MAINIGIANAIGFNDERAGGITPPSTSIHLLFDNGARITLDNGGVITVK